MLEDPRQALQEYADTCINCGVCARTDCGNFPEGTPDLGTIAQSLLDGDETWRHFPFTCALCNRCTLHCPVGLRCLNMSKPARALLLPRHEELRPLYRHFRTDLKYNLFSMLEAKNRDGDAEDVRYVRGEADLGGDADRTAFFPGCSLYCYAPELTREVSAWLREVGEASRTLTFCCGATHYDPGFFEEFRHYRVRAQRFLKEQGIERLIYTCPHCGYELPQLLEGTGIELVILEDVMLRHGKVSDFEGSISFHDACYDRQIGVYGKPARELYPKATFVEMPHTGDSTLCCGGGGMVSAYARDYCEYRRTMRLAEMDEVQADMILSTCFSCVNSLQRGDTTKPTRHYLEPIFDVEIDWAAVYASVDRLNADPKYTARLAEENPPLMFE